MAILKVFDGGVYLRLQRITENTRCRWFANSPRMVILVLSRTVPVVYFSTVKMVTLCLYETLDVCVPEHTVQHPRLQSAEQSSACEPKISHDTVTIALVVGGGGEVLGVTHSTSRTYLHVVYFLLHLYRAC